MIALVWIAVATRGRFARRARNASWLAWLALASCGRVHFDPRTDARGDDAPIDALLRCDPLAPFTSVRSIPELAIPSIDGALRLAADELTAFFHSDRVDGMFRLYVAQRASRDLPFGAAMSTEIFAYWPALSADALTLVYSVDLGGGFQEDIFVSTRASLAQPFPSATKVPLINTNAAEGIPMLGGNGSTLYFTRESMLGIPHLHVASWPDAATSRNLDELVTADGEASATISADELALYFAAPPVAGEPPDIYVATRASAIDRFGARTVIPELSSTGADSPTWLSPDHCRLYFESDRTGNYDVYVAERQP